MVCLTIFNTWQIRGTRPNFALYTPFPYISSKLVTSLFGAPMLYILFYTSSQLWNYLIGPVHEQNYQQNLEL